MKLNKIPLLVLLFFMALSCKKEATKWNTNWRTPLFYDTLGFQQLIDSNQIAVGTNDALQLTLNTKVFELDLFDLLNIPDTSLVQDYSIPVNNWFVSPGGSIPVDVTEFEFVLDDVELSTVIIKEGQASIRIENPLVEPTIFTITFPGVTKNGVVFTQAKEVPAAVNGVPGLDVITFDFSDYKFDLTGVDGNGFNLLESQLEVSLSSTANGVNITNQDVFKFYLDISELKIKYAKGYFGNIALSDTLDVKVKEIANLVNGSVDFDDVNISLEVRNGVNVNGQINLTLLESVATYGNVVEMQSAQLNVAQNINAAQSINGILVESEAYYNFTSLNSNIEDFLENLGDVYNVGYALEINPWGNTSGGYDEIYEGSLFGVYLRIDMPMAIGLQDLVYRDTFDFDLQQDLEAYHINHGKFIVNTVNSFPFSAGMSLVLLDENGMELTTLATSTDIQEAYATYTSGTTSLPTVEGQLEFALTEAQVALLNQTSKIALQINVDATNNSVQQLYLDSRIVVEVLTDFEMSHAY